MNIRFNNLTFWAEDTETLVERAARIVVRMEDEAVLAEIIKYLRQHGYTVIEPKLSDPDERMGA